MGFILVLYQIKHSDRIPLMINPEVPSIWLVPAKEDEKIISQTIKDLAERHHTLPFLPHITIYGGITADIQELISAAENAVQGISSFTVDVEKIAYSTEWSKTLYAQISQNEFMDEIHRRLRNKLKIYKDFVLDLHMSLVYKEEMTEEEKLREMERLNTPHNFIIDRIAVTNPMNPVERWKDISRWQTPFISRFNS